MRKESDQSSKSRLEERSNGIGGRVKKPVSTTKGTSLRMKGKRGPEKKPLSTTKGIFVRIFRLLKGLVSCTHHTTETPVERDDYLHFRKKATSHYDAMKSFYDKAAIAYSSGEESYAASLSEQAEMHKKKARKADEKASQDIFKAKNKSLQARNKSKEKQTTVTIDLHGQHAKEAIKHLKVQLLHFTTQVSDVHTLRVITGWGAHGNGKSRVKQSVIATVKKEGMQWSEENRGVILIKLKGRINV